MLGISFIACTNSLTFCSPIIFYDYFDVILERLSHDLFAVYSVERARQTKFNAQQIKPFDCAADVV